MDSPCVRHNVAVLGAGSWGTALALSLARAGRSVHLWARRPELARTIGETRENREYLPGAHLPATIEVSADMEAAIEGADLWLFCTPSQSVRSVAEKLVGKASANLIVFSAAKGIETGTLMTTTQVLADVLKAVPRSRMGVLYGPSHAEELAQDQPTAVVASGYDMAVAREVQHTFMTPALRVYVNDDVMGVEVGGSVKNVLAIAAGMSDGVGAGDNAKAALVTRGIAEIRRLGLAMGARPLTFAGLTGIGDLVVTCMSRHSRNRHLGEQIGRGRALEAVQAEMNMIAEGVATTASVHALAQRHGIEMPITEAVYQILFENKPPREALRELMQRAPKHEDWLPDDLQEG